MPPCVLHRREIEEIKKKFFFKGGLERRGRRKYKKSEGHLTGNTVLSTENGLLFQSLLFKAKDLLISTD